MSVKIMTSGHPGVGDVLAVRETISNSTTVVTAATPTAGTRIKIISVIISYDSATATAAEVYFGTGASIGTDETKVIAEAFMLSPQLRLATFDFPDEGRKVGAVDEVVSVRAGAAVVATLSFIIHYREE